MAVIDEGAGNVWNQRNRLAADRNFLADINDICEDTYSYIMGITPSTPQDLCKASAEAYYRGVRTSFWPPGTSSFDIMRGSLIPETTSESNSVTANASFIVDTVFGNRPLPINYLSMDGVPFAPQTISRLPINKAFQVELTRANQLTTNGVLPTTTYWDHYYKTDQMRVNAHYPMMVSFSDNITCPTWPQDTSLYLDRVDPPNPFPTDGNDLVHDAFYIKLCAESTDLTVDLLELLPVEARQFEIYLYQDGDRVRHYENVNALDLSASLSPNPETLTLETDGTWSSPISVSYSHHLDALKAVANPHDPTPLAEFTTGSSSTNYCLNGAETNDTFTVLDSYIVHVAMCDAGTGDIELRDPETGIVLQSYTLTAQDAQAPTPNSCDTSSIFLSSSYRSGVWDSGDCTSPHRPDRYVDYYTIQLNRATEVQIDLTSSTDTYLQFWTGTDTSVSPDETNDDDGVGYNSRIERELAADTMYTIGATTYGDGETGSYRIRVMEVSTPSEPAPTPTPVPPPTPLPSTAAYIDPSPARHYFSADGTSHHQFHVVTSATIRMEVNQAVAGRPARVHNNGTILNQNGCTAISSSDDTSLLIIPPNQGTSFRGVFWIVGCDPGATSLVLHETGRTPRSYTIIVN